MFSDHFRKIDEVPARTLLLIAAGLVIVCQLVAMVMVTGGQVEKAQLREASQASARAASVWCIETSHGAALRECDPGASSFSAQSDVDQTIPTPQGVTAVTLSKR